MFRASRCDNLGMNPTPLNSLQVDPVLDEQIDSSSDPLVVELKNENRLDNLRTNMRVSTSLQFNTSPMSRVMRRDWNLVSAKLFLNTLDREKCAVIKEDLIEFTWQCNALLETLQAIPMASVDPFYLHPRRLDIQIVHPLAAGWLRAMRTLDECYVIMINAEKSGRISRKQRWALATPCQLSYMGFKSSAMDRPLSQTTQLIEDTVY